MEDAKAIIEERLPEQVVEHTLDAPASPPASPSAKKRKERQTQKVSCGECTRWHRRESGAGYKYWTHEAERFHGSTTSICRSTSSTCVPSPVSDRHRLALCALCSCEVLSPQALTRACRATIRKASQSVRTLSLLPQRGSAFQTRIRPTISTAETSSLFMIVVVAHQSESTRYGLTFPDDFLHVDAEYFRCCWKCRSSSFLSTKRSCAPMWVVKRHDHVPLDF